MNLEYLSALELGQKVREKEVSPAEVIDYFVDRIEKRNPSLNAFVYLKVEDAFKEAVKLEKRIMSGEDVGPFAGVPVGLKDFLPSKKGWTNSHGGVEALIMEDDSDSAFYSAARRAGAIAIGKTNAPAFGFSGCTDNKLYGPTKNPFDLRRNSGGSSGGSAAAVADGLVPMCEGGDAGGSIRIPASWCNLFGFKASLGTIPSYCRPDGWAATHPYCFSGALTKTVEDSAVMLEYMSQYNSRDPISLPVNSKKKFYKLMKKSIKRKKIALTYSHGLFELDPRIGNQISRTVKNLELTGAKVDIIPMEFKHSLDEFVKVWLTSISVDTALDLKMWKSRGLDLIKDYRDQLPEEWIHYNERAMSIDIDDFRYFNEVRTDILDAYENVFEKYDIILSPVTNCLPVFNGDEWGTTTGPDKINGVEVPGCRIAFGQTFLVNFIGYPAASVPAGFVDDVPVGLQIIGRQYKDEDVLAVAHAVEQVQPWDYSKSFDRI